MELGDAAKLLEPAVDRTGKFRHLTPGAKPPHNNVLRSTSAHLLFQLIHGFMMIFDDLQQPLGQKRENKTPARETH